MSLCYWECYNLCEQLKTHCCWEIASGQLLHVKTLANAHSLPKAGTPRKYSWEVDDTSFRWDPLLPIRDETTSIAQYITFCDASKHLRCAKQSFAHYHPQCNSFYKADHASERMVTRMRLDVSKKGVTKLRDNSQQIPLCNNVVCLAGTTLKGRLWHWIFCIWANKLCLFFTKSARF